MELLFFTVLNLLKNFLRFQPFENQFFMVLYNLGTGNLYWSTNLLYSNIYFYYYFYPLWSWSHRYFTTSIIISILVDDKRIIKYIICIMFQIDKTPNPEEHNVRERGDDGGRALSPVCASAVSRVRLLCTQCPRAQAEIPAALYPVDAVMEVMDSDANTVLQSVTKGVVAGSPAVRTWPGVVDNVTNASVFDESNLPHDMRFNEGHVVAIVTYSILMVVSAIGNITVLTIILKRRRKAGTRIHAMLMHLAIADLLVSGDDYTSGPPESPFEIFNLTEFKFTNRFVYFYF